MIHADADVPALSRIDDARVSLLPLDLGRITVHASLPELAGANGAAPGIATLLGLGTARVTADFAGYYSLGAAGAAPASATGRRRASRRRKPDVESGPGGPAGSPWPGARWRPWPWPPELDPFLLLAHTARGNVTLAVDGKPGRVTNALLGSWLRRLPQLDAATRPLENPLVLLTCPASSTQQELADAVGRMVWFPDSMAALFAGPDDPAGGAAAARMIVGLDGTGSGRFRSAYPQGPAGDRVRRALRDRFAASAADWLVEQQARAGARVPHDAPPWAFGGRDLRGLSYFDRRDRASRAAALSSPALDAGHVAWTPNDAYRPGADARPWNSRDLGELPFGLGNAAVVVTYYADGRFAVYDERHDLAYWETPLDFGRRLRRDLTAGPAGPPPRVLLLADFDALTDQARAEVARGLGGPELITPDTPATLFASESPRDASGQARIALLAGHGSTAAPGWTSTTSAGVSTRLAPARPASGTKPASSGAPHQEVERELPVGFGEPALDRRGLPRIGEDGRPVRRYPLGHQGRLDELGQTPLENVQGIGDLLAAGLPAGDRALASLASREIVAFTFRHGRHELTRRLLTGTLTLTDGAPGGRVLTFRLEPDLPRAEQARGTERRPGRIATKRHHAVEADQQAELSVRIGTGPDRSASATLDVLNLLGPREAAPSSVRVEVTPSAGTSAEYVHGYDVVTAAKRAPRYEHQSAEFLVPSVLRVRVADGAGEPRERRTSLTARFAFPEEICPVKRPGDPPGAYREPPRTMPGAPVLGLSQQDLDQMRADGGEREAVAAERALAAVLPRFLHMPESAADLAGVYRDMRAALAVAPASPGAAEDPLSQPLRDLLGEPWFLKQYGDVTTPTGALSPLITGPGGEPLGRLRLTAALRTAQAADLSSLGLKEELQRFVAALDQESSSSDAGLEVNVVASHVIGDPSAPPGGNSHVGGGGGPTVTLSSSRSQTAGTGSGDIRGTVIWGDSVIYRAVFHATGEWIPQSGEPRSFTEELRVNLRISAFEAARFEYEMRRAAGHADLGAEPVDDEPDAADPRRYPPAVILANQGTGAAGVLHLPGAENVLPAVMKLIREAEAGLGWTEDWTPAEAATTEFNLSPRLSGQGLKAHGSALFRLGGFPVSGYRQARWGGTERISVRVAAWHGTEEPKSGRLKKATFENMPSAFYGIAGKDTITSELGGQGQLSAAVGRSEETEPRTGGVQLQAGAQLTHQAETTAGFTGFTLQAVLAEGPAWYFRYKTVSYRISVKVRWEGNLPSHDRVRAMLVRTGTATVVLGAAAVVRRRPEDGGGPEPDYGVTFIINAGLARTEPEPAEAVAAVGQVLSRVDGERPSRLLVPGPRLLSRMLASAWRGRLTLPELRQPALGFPPRAGGFDPVEDQLIEVLGAPVGQAIEGMLRDLALSEGVIGDLPWVMAEQAGAQVVRGGAVSRQRLVQPGAWLDRHVTVTVVPTPAGSRLAQPGTVTLTQMHVSEGSVIIGGMSSTGFALGGALSLPVLGFGGREWSGTGLWPTYGRPWARAAGRAFTLTPTTGRLTQQELGYAELTDDMAWLITITETAELLGWTFLVDARPALVVISQGRSYLKRVTAGPDPRSPSAPAPADAVPLVRATTRSGDTRTLPWYWPLPASAVHDKFFPMPSDEQYPRPAGSEEDPLQAGIRRLLSEHAPELLDAHVTIGADDSRQRKVKVSEALDLSMASTMIDLVLSTGVPLNVTVPGVDGGMLGNWRYELLIRGRQHINGRFPLGAASGSMNTVRYATMLQLRDQLWSRRRGGNVPAGGAPGGWQGTVHLARTAAPPESAPDGGQGSEGQPAEGQAGVTLSHTQTTEEPGYQRAIGAQRRTGFVPAEADYLGVPFVFTVLLGRTFEPSRPLNVLGLGVPRMTASLVQGSREQRTWAAQAEIPVWQRMLNPRVPAETPPPDPGEGSAAVRELAPGANPGRVLRVTPEEILRHEVRPLGAHHEKFQVLADEVLAKLAGNEVPLSGDRSLAVAALTERGSRARQALLSTLSYGIMAGYLDELVKPGGAEFPVIAVEGGPLTDTYGKTIIQVEFTDPWPLGYYHNWLEAINYQFAERQGGWQQTTGLALGAGGGPASAPGSGTRPQIGALPGLTGGNSSTRASIATSQLMTRYDGERREVPELKASTHMKITVTVTAQNARDWFRVPVPGLGGGTVTVSYLVHHAMVLGFSPEGAIRHGLYHRDGLPVPSGLFFPRPGTDLDRLRAAFLVPALSRAFAVQADLGDDGRFLAGDGAAGPRQLAESIKRWLADEPGGPAWQRHLEPAADPVVLLTAGAALPRRGKVPAQELADAVQQPVAAPRAGYRVTRTGEVHAEGGFLVFFPGRGPTASPLLPGDLADLLAAGRDGARGFRWSGRVAAPPAQDVAGIPAHDVHVTAESLLARRARHLLGPGARGVPARELAAVIGLADRLSPLAETAALAGQYTDEDLFRWLDRQLEPPRAAGEPGPHGSAPRPEAASVLGVFGLLRLAADLSRGQADLTYLRGLRALTGLAGLREESIVTRGAAQAVEALAAALDDALPRAMRDRAIPARPKVILLLSKAVPRAQAGRPVTRAALRAAFLLAALVEDAARAPGGTRPPGSAPQARPGRQRPTARRGIPAPAHPLRHAADPS